MIFANRTVQIWQEGYTEVGKDSFLVGFNRL